MASNKLHSVEKTNFFDDYNFIIKLQSEVFPFDKPKPNPKKYEYSEITNQLTFLHEYQHYLNMIGTPVGIFYSFLKIASLVKISYILKSIMPKGQKFELPFYDHMDEFPEIASIYKFSEAVSSYLYCKPEIDYSTAIDIDSLKKYKLTVFDCRNILEVTGGKVKPEYPSLFVTAKKNNKTISNYMHIGLYTILEGFSRSNQDFNAMQAVKGKQTRQFINDYEKRMFNPKHTPYYVLYNYAYNILDDSSGFKTQIIVNICFYLSLLCLRPINQWPYQGIDIYEKLQNGIDDETINFLKNISHPGITFIDSLFALENIVKEKGGIPVDEAGIVGLVRETCERIGCRPVNYLYDSFSLFFKQAINSVFPNKFDDHYFAKHFFETSLEFMNIAKDNIYDSIFHPWLLDEKTEKDILPMIFGDKCTNTVATEKTYWFLFSNVMEQFFHKKRIFCTHKIYFGSNWHCKNDKECSIDKIDFPYTKCEQPFINTIVDALGYGKCTYRC